MCSWARAAPAHSRSGSKVKRSLRVIILSLAFAYQLVLQFVPVVRGARKMLGQDITAALDCGAKRGCAVVGFEPRGDRGDDLVPGACLDLVVDAAVGEHQDAVLEQRGENQNSGVSLRIMKTVCGKSGE